jgi:hypothetical protein
MSELGWVFIFILQGFHKCKRNVNHIWQLLLYTRRVFYKIDLSSPLNMEAATLYERDIEQFQARVRSCVTDRKEKLYLVKDHPDPHYLTLSSFKEQIHGPVREKMKRGVVGHSREEEGGSGVGDRKSYVATGSLTIFSEKLLPAATEGPKSMPK